MRSDPIRSDPIRCGAVRCGGYHFVAADGFLRRLEELVGLHLSKFGHAILRKDLNWHARTHLRRAHTPIERHAADLREELAQIIDFDAVLLYELAHAPLRVRDAVDPPAPTDCCR
jgi:hypothetical protein